MDRKRIACFVMVSTIMVSGCAASVDENSSSPGWNAYNAFQRELNQKPENPDYKQHLSGGWIDLFDEANDNAELAQVREYATYPRWLSKTLAHYEKANGEGRCLSVNGVALDQSPGTLSVRYVEENGRLKASEIHYQYWETKDEFPSEARCPEEFELAFPAP